VAEIVKGARQFWLLLMLYTRSGQQGPTEFGLAGTLLALGLYLAEPFNWWHTFAVAASFQGLALVADEHIWGIALVLLALASFAGMTADAANSGRQHTVHVVTAYIQLAWWLFFTISILLTNLSTTGWVTFGSLSVGQAWVCYRLSQHT
jgi:drug/metabolite transporter (DMT)-like permease